MERVKDIQFSSKQRLNTQRIRELLEMRTALRRLLNKLPPNLAADPDAQKLVPLCDSRDWTIVHINNRRPQQGGQTKDAEFSRSAVIERWASGLEDVRFSTANLEWTQPIEYGEGVRVLYLPPAAPHMGSARPGPAAPKIAAGSEGAEHTARNETRPRRSA
jgi:NTE family protein